MTAALRMVRRSSGLLALVASVLLIVACQSTATVEMMDSAASDSDDTGTADGGALDTSETETDTADHGSGDDGEVRFDVQGELPLSVAEVNGLVAYVEEQTGRAFLRPPVIVAQTADQFTEGLQEDLGDFYEDADVSVRQLQALGLTDKGVAEVAGAFETLLLSPEGILGYYDPATDELYVPVGAEADDAFRSLLVHELVHALDGQHVDLTQLEALSDAAEETGDYEAVGAFQAVAEGRATVVQRAWERENNYVQEIPDDLGAAADVPPALVLSLSIPYVFGEQWVMFNGGAPGTWDAFESPPPSSEVYMIPGTPESEPIIDVATPDADGPVLYEADWGAADLLVWLLGEELEPDPEIIFPTITAIDGWAGGRSVLWGDDAESCMRIELAADNDADLDELQSVLQSWADGDPADRTVELDGDRIVVTGCAPYLP